MNIHEFAAAVTERCHAPATEAEITAFETLIGYVLPSDYRAFLKICGGGYMKTQPMFNWHDGGWAGRAKTIGGLRDDNPWYSLMAQWRESESKLPKDLLWILEDHGGNPVALALSGPEVGRLFFVDHDAVPDDSEWDGTLSDGVEYGYLLPLAPSFTAFVSGIDAASGFESDE